MLFFWSTFRKLLQYSIAAPPSSSLHIRKLLHNSLRSSGLLYFLFLSFK